MAFFHGRNPEPATHFGGSLVGQSNSGTAELADGLEIQPVSDNSSVPERLHHYAQFHMNITHALLKMARVGLCSSIRIAKATTWTKASTDQ